MLWEAQYMESPRKQLCHHRLIHVLRCVAVLEDEVLMPSRGKDNIVLPPPRAGMLIAERFPQYRC